MINSAAHNLTCYILPRFDPNSAMPHRYPMPPPELAADAPVAFGAQPVGVRLFVPPREDVHLVAIRAGGGLIVVRVILADCVDGHLCQAGRAVQVADALRVIGIEIAHLHEPLVG